MAQPIKGLIQSRIIVKSVWETLDEPNPMALSGRGRIVRTDAAIVELHFGNTTRVVKFDDVHTALKYAESQLPARGYCWLEDYTANEAKRHCYKDGQRGIAYANVLDEDGVGHNWEWEAK